MNSTTSDDSQDFRRSSLLMNPHDTALVVVDVQEKLTPHIDDAATLIWNIGRLLRGARELEIASYVTEQYPAGLGPTIASVAQDLGSDDAAHEKTMFSCRECETLLHTLEENGIRNVVMVGVETHVCVLQSAFDFMAAGLDVHVCVDAVGSRFAVDRETALRRMESAGITMATTEMVLFEWCTTASHPAFKSISRIVREPSPSSS